MLEQTCNAWSAELAQVVLILLINIHHSCGKTLVRISNTSEVLEGLLSYHAVEFPL